MLDRIYGYYGEGGVPAVAALRCFRTDGGDGGGGGEGRAAIEHVVAENAADRRDKQYRRRVEYLDRRFAARNGA